MKKLIILLVLFSTSFVLSAQIGVGVRDNRYINVSYGFLRDWSVKFEESVYSEKIGFQYFRLYASYSRTFKMVDFKIEPYFGMTYNNSYSNEGISFEATLKPCKWVDVTGGVTPHNDSGFGYSTCYFGGFRFNFSHSVALTGSVTNRPEYRKPESRLRGGLRFNVNNLWVHPEVSAPVEKGEGKNIRMLVSMGYTF